MGGVVSKTHTHTTEPRRKSAVKGTTQEVCRRNSFVVMAEQQRPPARDGRRGRDSSGASSGGGGDGGVDLSALDNFLITFVNLPFALVVPTLLAAIAGIGWAMVKYA